jgi:hypothetical protein
MTDVAIRKGGNDFSMYFDPAKFDHCQRVATMLSKSNIVPEHFQNNVANCFIALQMATRMGMEPLAFMQKSFVLKGKPGIEAQIGIAALNNSGLIKGRISYDLSGEGQNRKCTASVVDASTGERFEFSITVGQATSVGAASTNPNWKALPDLMLRYRSATYLIRTHYPDVLMGLYTKDELEDMVDVSPSKRPYKHEERPEVLEAIPTIAPEIRPEEPVAKEPIATEEPATEDEELSVIIQGIGNIPCESLEKAANHLIQYASKARTDGRTKELDVTLEANEAVINQIKDAFPGFYKRIVG